MRLFHCGFYLAFVATTVFAVEPDHEHSLEIFPDIPVITPAVGDSLALSCKPNTDNARLISQLEWLDPLGRKIDGQNTDAALYIQKMPNEVGLLLIFTKITQNFAGEYTCRAYYDNTEPLMKKIKVQTYVDVFYKDAPENQYPVLGEDFRVKCEVGGNPSPLVSWQRNNKEIVQGDSHYIIDTNALLIKNVTESDDGYYICKAIVLATGSIKIRNIKVEVQVPPTIEPMSEVKVIEGERAEIKCKAYGKPPPTYTWIKDDTRQNLATTDRFDVNKIDGTLIINRVEYNDNSLYSCVAENQANKANASVKVSVLVKPRIYEFINITARVEKETKIICKAYGRPVPNVLFRKFSNLDTYKIGRNEEGGRIIIENMADHEKGEMIGIMTIRNVTRKDDGLYECVAENEVTAAYKNGHITVEFPPSFEATKNFPPVWTWRDLPANLTCIAESIPNATIRWKIGGLDLTENEQIKIQGKGPVSSLIITPRGNARFFTKYECIANNPLGENHHFLELREARVPASLSQVKVDSITATTIKFSIVGPQNFHGLPLRSYIVQYRRDQDLGFEDRAFNHTWSVDAPYILENLIPQVTYHFRFAAINDVGRGNWGNDQTHTMPRRSAPAEPRILSFDRDNNNANLDDVVTNSPYPNRYELRWSVPNDNGDPIINYIIRYCVTKKINGQWKEDQNDWSAEIRQPFAHTSFEFTDLRPATTYKIELRAENAIGLSTPAQIKVKTAVGMDPMVHQHEGPRLTSALIIGLVVAGVFLLLIFVDLICFCAKRAGILAAILDRVCAKSHDDEDPKLSSYKAAPAHPSSLNLPLPVKLPPTPPEEKEPLNGKDISGEKRNISVEFDGQKTYTKPVEIGRHSAV